MEKFNIEIEYGYFAEDGKRFISFGLNGLNRGMGSPLPDNKAEALKEMRENLKSYGVTEKNIDVFTDKTGLFPKGELFGQSLLEWV